MHVIDETERFTLLGSSARRGKITLFDAGRPTRAWSSLASRRLPRRRSRGGDRAAPGRGSRSIGRATARRTSTSPKVCVSGSSSPRPTWTTTSTTSRSSPRPRRRPAARSTARSASRPAARPGHHGPHLASKVGGAWVEFHPGEPGAPERPLLNHLAVLVDSADEHIAAANELGVEIDDVVDAANTRAVFLWGPDGVRVEYVEHKSTFSLT